MFFIYSKKKPNFERNKPKYASCIWSHAIFLYRSSIEIWYYAKFLSDKFAKNAIYRFLCFVISEICKTILTLSKIGFSHFTKTVLILIWLWARCATKWNARTYRLLHSLKCSCFTNVNKILAMFSMWMSVIARGIYLKVFMQNIQWITLK